MPLTPQQIQKFQNWLNSKNVTPNCPSCGGRNWTPGEIISSPIFTKGRISLGGRNIPMVQMLCNDCAFVKLYAAVPMDLP